jgi:hypothetical protein
MADDYNDLLQQAQTEETRQTALAQQMLGEHQTTQEQDAYQTAIDLKQNAGFPLIGPTRFPAMGTT